MGLRLFRINMENIERWSTVSGLRGNEEAQMVYKMRRKGGQILKGREIDGDADEELVRIVVESLMEIERNGKRN